MSGYEQRTVRTYELGVVPTNSSLKIEWMDSKEAASFLRISEQALRNMTSNGRIPFYKLGRRNRYRKDELTDLVLSQRKGKL